MFRSRATGACWTWTSSRKSKSTAFVANPFLHGIASGPARFGSDFYRLGEAAAQSGRLRNFLAPVALGE